ncbi:MAG: glycosyltransferase [Actinobacteria bacterium]|nr:glycosyltransferase [Actinomycetota bacterium]
MMEKVAIILPTYNENENIGEMIEILENNIFPEIRDFEMSILVVDDSSSDGTIDIVKKKKENYKNLEITIDAKKGLGIAYKRGVDFAINEIKADAVIKMDADFQHNPLYVLDLIDKYRQGFNYVIGSRYCNGGSVPKEWGFFRKLISKYGGLYTRIVLFFPRINVVKDVSSGFVLASVEKVLKHIDFSQLTSGFYYSQQLIFQVVNMGIKIAEVPINFGPRLKNNTKMPISNIFGTLLSMPVKRLRGFRRY